MNPPPRLLTTADWILMASLLMGVILALILLPGHEGPGKTALVQHDQGRSLMLDLNRDQEVDVGGPLGTSRLQVSDGRVRIVSSPCPHKICVRTGFRHRSGDMIACIPNRIIVRLEGDRTAGPLDGITR